VREAREPRKRYVQSKEEEEHRFVHQSSQRDPEVSEYSNLVEKTWSFRVAHKLRIPPSSSAYIPVFRATYHTIYIQRVC